MRKTFLNPNLIAFVCLFHAQVFTQNYTFKKASSDGIGKVYKGREISKVMGHYGAAWLDRSSREAEESPNLAVELLNLNKEMLVVDFGAGSGYFTSKLARQCSVVYAVDVQQEMLEINAAQMRKKNITNVKYVLGKTKYTNLPKNTFDLFLLVDVYHELEYPYEIMKDIKSTLKDDGVVVLLEYRKEDPSVPIKPLHKMSVKQVVKEMKNIGLTLIDNIQKLPRQHMLIFGKS
ncbi:MAG: SAM-dependent methyltransferase [Candidatus Marinimicrobia bacterium]|nr:SAM-dependent methyltransferase [Candidatus Neomarinimicrobiota bacterium]|tara:strand:+ start:48 stop:746 length:699 start_codon:yes stop_codon:yes gene_type:complete